MNREYKDCDIVFDLLPLYIDGKTGEESKTYVSVHLTQCEDCRQTYQFMQEDFGNMHIKENLNLSKKCHRRCSKRKWIMIGALAGYILALMAFVYWFFCAAVLPVL